MAPLFRLAGVQAKVGGRRAQEGGGHRKGGNKEKHMLSGDCDGEGKPCLLSLTGEGEDDHKMILMMMTMMLIIMITMKMLTIMMMTMKIMMLCMTMMLMTMNMMTMNIGL